MEKIVTPREDLFLQHLKIGKQKNPSFFRNNIYEITSLGIFEKINFIKLILPC